jgi:hypothetical protein
VARPNNRVQQHVSAVLAPEIRCGKQQQEEAWAALEAQRVPRLVLALFALCRILLPTISTRTMQHTYLRFTRHFCSRALRSLLTRISHPVLSLVRRVVAGASRIETSLPLFAQSLSIAALQRYIAHHCCLLET